MDHPPGDQSEGGEDDDEAEHFDDHQTRDRRSDVVEEERRDQRDVAVALGQHPVGLVTTDAVGGERPAALRRQVGGVDGRGAVVLVADVRGEAGAQRAAGVDVALIRIADPFRRAPSGERGGSKG